MEAPPWARRLQEVVEDRTGLTVRPADEVALLEASDVERRALQKELDLLGWHVLDHFSGQPQEVRLSERRKMAQQARMIWMQDPQAGAAVDLLNDFVFGRGVPKPKAVDPKVQDILDEVWDDEDNKRVLTSYEAQVALGTDLQLQSNIFILFFIDGDDGKVKLGLLPHDLVENAVQDPENFLRVTHYVARKREVQWDIVNDRPAVKPPEMNGGKPQILYYENLRELDDDGNLEASINVPKVKQGEGYVYHIAVNRTTEQVFGIPSMRRLVKWLSAFNDYMSARVDLAQASAAFIMKRQVKGTANQVAKLAAKAISRRSDLASSAIDDPQLQPGPRPASVLTENDTVTHSPFSLNTNAGQAQQDAQMIRSQISAGTRWPAAYFGDASNSNLATATSLELPILKLVESRQELFEGIFRTLFDHAIQRAIDKGKLSEKLTPEEVAAAKAKEPKDPQAPGPAPGTDPTAMPPEASQLQHAAAGAPEEEKENDRDLTYEFSMPNPLKRAIADLIGAIANIARTFDPNNTNLELSKTLLNIALGEGLEVQDPAAAVDRIFPEGYQDPAVLAAQAAQAPPLVPPQDQNFFGPNGGQTDGTPGSDPNNPYGAPGMSSQYQANAGQMQQALLEAAPLPVAIQRKLKSRVEALDELWADEVADLAHDMLAERADANGH